MCVCVLGVYEGWEGESFPCIRVQKSPDPQNPDGIPRWVSECMCVWDYTLGKIKYNTIYYTNLYNLKLLSFPPVGFRCEWMRERGLTVWVCVKGWTGIWGWAPCLWRTHVNYERRTALPSHPIALCLRRKRYVHLISLLVRLSFIPILHSFSVSFSDGDPSRPRGDGRVSVSVYMSVSVCGWHHVSCSLHPSAQ